MKTTDHNVDYLCRSLHGEAESLRSRIIRLENLAKQVKRDVRDGAATVHTFEFVAQEAIDISTHRSNVFLSSIARTCASLAADAAVEWAEKQAKESA